MLPPICDKRFLKRILRSAGFLRTHKDTWMHQVAQRSEDACCRASHTHGSQSHTPTDLPQLSERHNPGRISPNNMSVTHHAGLINLRWAPQLSGRAGAAGDPEVMGSIPSGGRHGVRNVKGGGEGGEGSWVVGEDAGGAR